MPRAGGLGRSPVLKDPALGQLLKSVTLDKSSEMTIGETLQAYANAFVSGDRDRYVAMIADDFVLHYFGSSPLAGDHVGKPAALQALREASKRSARRIIDLEDVLAGEVYGALVTREEVGAEARTRIRRVFLYKTAGGLLTECWVYNEDQSAMDKMWTMV